MNKEHTLCIPRVLKDTTCGKIRQILEKANIGKIVSITELNSSKDPLYKRVIFSAFIDENTTNGEVFKSCINRDTYTKLVYNFPWYWRIYVNSHQK